ncbi:condensation domain-containing protein [Ruminiclostridium cellobioparum]|jgi:non-ribosomal peptide synthase protein (TIGR01720 family)|uniref:condensation domain-containing protein n=1 Tax=Ruminiclostridium cellobioparum TaxID=29355 RepID=UPI00048410F4
MAVKQWNRQNCVAVEMEGHGREELHKAVDISRTVGWFASIYPIVLETSIDIEEMIINTKEMLRRIPHHGVGYGVAKHLGQYEWANVEADLCFNYLGHLDHELGANGRIAASNLSCGSSIPRENISKQSITMNGSITGGKLRFDVAYNRGRYSRQSMEQFCQRYIESIKTIVQYCISQEKVVKTASDYGIFDVSQDVLKELNDMFN